MPLCNYCKKCNVEVPLGDTCPFCDRKLTKTGEMVTFSTVRVPVKDGFIWTKILRILLPVWLIVSVIPLASEISAHGVNGGAALISEGYLFGMLALLGAFLLFTLLILLLQGEETVHYTFDKDGIVARTFLSEPSKLRLLTRFQSEGSCRRLMQTEARQPSPGLLMVNRVALPWEKIRKANCWREGGAFLIYRYWKVLSIDCLPQEYPCAEEYLRKKMKKYKKAEVLPPVNKKRNTREE